MQLSRRGVLTGGALGGGMMVAWVLLPRSYPNPLQAGHDEVVFAAWLKIALDGVVSVTVPQLEMGQGITTLLPQIVAEELGADWRQIAVEPAGVSGHYANIPLAQKWSEMWMSFDPAFSSTIDEALARRFAEQNRFSATADGTALAAFEQPCREAAASARAMLVQAAAQQWEVEPEQCEVSAGFIIHGEKRLRFGELAEAAAQQTPPDPPPLRSQPYAESPFNATGITGAGNASPYVRLDYPSKVAGTYQFAGDVRLPQMVYAAIAHGPRNRAVLKSFDAAAGAQVSGFVEAIEGKRWLAAAATNWWAAEQALKAMRPRFDVDKICDSQKIEAALDRGIEESPAYRLAERGEGYENVPDSDFTLRYDYEPALHAPLETASATARFDKGKLELWIAAQAPQSARQAAARALGLSEEDVVLYPMPAGGSFDSRLEHAHAIEVALIARALERPVQLMWSRWQELLHGIPRSPASILISAQLSRTNRGMITGLNTRICCPSTNLEFGQRLFANKTSWAAIRESAGEADVLAVEGAMPPYAIPDIGIDHVPVETGLPSARMRGNAHALTCFANECMIDEIARKHNREPLSYRVALLADDVRMAECLQVAGRIGKWDGGMQKSGQGLACHRIGSIEEGGRIACIAHARPGEGGVRVTKLVAAVDIGRIVNLDIARQQIEGGLVFGLAQAMGASTRYRAGMPERQSLAALNLPNLVDCPEIEVEFIASTAPAFDPGELGTVVAPPAIANALFSATGLRLRRLPLLSGGL